MTIRRGLERSALLVILLAATLLRLHNIGFGLPSMYDPDEPMFMLKSVEMLTKGSLNPHWFGHPGTTTLYTVALVDAAVVAIGRLSGAWPSIAAFTQAAFADPGLLFIPARIAMAVFGVAVVGMTYVVGTQLFSRTAGLIAAAFLAFNAVHVAWSQVVRTDVQASMFMLVSMAFAIRALRTGTMRDFILAGLLTGVAIATKWPAASIFSATIGAAVGRGVRQGALRPQLRNLALAGAAVVVGLFLSSPFIFIEWRTVLSNLGGEARPFHLDHTGGGFLYNLVWYFRTQLLPSMGWSGLLLVVAGGLLAGWRSFAARVTLVPATVVFLVMISAQHLIWSRWIVPGLPMFCIFAAFALCVLADVVTRRLRVVSPGAVLAGLTTLAFVPVAVAEAGQVRERETDTRALAARWAVRHVPPGSTVVLEHLELSLRNQPWRILFPIGEAGCIDGPRLLKAGVHSDEVSKDRGKSAIVDIGNVDPARLGTCRADYAILVYYDLYRHEQFRFPNQNRVYDQLLAGGRTVALFRPITGAVGGPVTRIVAIPRR